MLARLSQAAELCGSERFFLDMEEFRLVLPAVDWERMALACVHPVYKNTKNLYTTFRGDFDKVTHLLAALDDDHLHDEPASEQSVISSAQTSIPSIVITPCPDAPLECLSRVPVQDSAFRMQLTVPMLPSLNRAFPPMALAPRRLPPDNHWVWKNGHWQVAVRGEQRPRKLKHRKKAKATRPKAAG